MTENVLHLYDRRKVEEEASDWIVYFDGNQSIIQSDVDKFKTWVARSPMHKQIITEYVSLWDNMDLLSELMLSVPSKKHQGDLSRSSTKEGILSVGSWWSDFKVWGGASLTLVLFVVVMSGLYSQYVYYPSTNGVYVTQIGETQTLALSDESIVWLNTDSRLEVDYNGANRRIVLHQGEAHFQVEKNADLPFQVFAADKMVKAVGTAFSVYKKDESVHVTVTEGRVDIVVPKRLGTVKEVGRNGLEAASPIELEVDVDENGSSKVLGSLDAGQSINLLMNQTSSIVDVVVLEQREMNQQLAWRQGLLMFSGEPLQEVIQEVSRYSNIDITISDPELSSMRIGGQFKIGETDALFDVLENGFGLKISRLDVDRVDIHARH